MAPVLRMHDVIGASVLHCLRIAGLIGRKLLANEMSSTMPRASHSATGLARRDETRGISVGAGNDFAVSCSAASSA